MIAPEQAAFTVLPEELLAVREALLQDAGNLGVGVVHLPTARIALRPFDRLQHRGGHVELAGANDWAPDHCLGFLVARPTGECVMINRSQLNAQTGPLQMPQVAFRKVLLSLRQCWAGMAACAR
jgi:hypothetical protein